MKRLSAASVAMILAALPMAISPAGNSVLQNLKGESRYYDDPGYREFRLRRRRQGARTYPACGKRQGKLSCLS